MNAKDLFLTQHAAVQSLAVGGNPFSAAERTLAGLSDEQMRVRPREDLNSLAWILWHIARAEDIFVNAFIAGRPQVWDEAWGKRLGVTRRDFGIGMTSAEVSELTRAIDLAAARRADGEGVHRAATRGGPQRDRGDPSRGAFRRGGDRAQRRRLRHRHLILVARV
jgi:DinB superfamily